MSNEPLDPELSSPACSMRTADDAYMGFMPQQEVVAFLNELLVAERAGARVGLKSQQEASTTDNRTFFEQLSRDESSCCAMLARHISERGGIPSEEVGAFFQSAMAIADTNARLGFLNRGQGWVVKRLRTTLPRIRDDKLHADLTAMLDLHVRNIAATNDLLAQLTVTTTTST